MQEKGRPGCGSPGQAEKTQSHQYDSGNPPPGQAPSAPDLEEFRRLAGEGFSLIRLIGKDPKPTEGKGWTRYCIERRSFDQIPFRPGENAGIPCGPANEIIVLDEDDPEKFRAFLSAHGYELPRTRVHGTGTEGKKHHLYRYPDDGCVYHNRSKKLWGFDIRGMGGQIVASGSIHPDTAKKYVVLDDCPIAPAPAWLLSISRGEDPVSQAQTDVDGIGWDGNLDTLPISDRVKDQITNPPPRGERSEQEFGVLLSLIKAGLGNDEIKLIWMEHPIGSRFRERGENVPWLNSQIGKARARAAAEEPQFEPLPQGEGGTSFPNGAKDSEVVGKYISTIASALSQDFSKVEIPPRAWLVENLIYQGQNALFFAKPGVGKTLFAAELGAACSRGGGLFGPYRASNPVGVIYLDGEMSAAEFQERFRRMRRQPDWGRFRVISAELLATAGHPVPNLADESWRTAFLEYLKTNPQWKILIVDNLSSLTPGTDESGSLEWDPLNQWLLSLRRLGLSTLLVHHAGKNGQQRGTSKREDQIDLNLKLTKIENRSVSAFKVSFEKGRSLPESAKKPFVLERTDVGHMWELSYRAINEDQLSRIAFLVSRKWTQGDIAKEVGITQSAVSKKVKRAMEEGILTEGLGLTAKGEELCVTMTED